MKVTLTTIADDLGVSTATVSLALRDSPLVAAATTERIKRRAKEIGYVYDRRAASLRTQRSDIVGVLVRDIINPFFAEILGSIEAELSENRQTFLLCNHGDDIALQEDFISTLMQFGADGVIMSPSVGTSAEDIRKIEENGLPVTLVARTVEDAGVPAFLGDDVTGFELVTSHLISKGHRDIALIGGTRLTSTGRARRAGFAQAFEKAGLPLPQREDFETPYDRRAGYEAVTKLLANGPAPDAVACCSDTVALGVMHGLRAAGLEPGRDIAVTGYDNITEAAIAFPPLTTVDDGHGEIGKLAARALYSKIKKEECSTEAVLVKPSLMERASVNERS
ncbi:LacI family DNA-binding transcriptional regulator [Ahrensia sp. R2A130]|uniref:LacI family DNA-binding transcriptional regulator n=1 Tax=Ahrensia sp. R2A130 TaxID=744979 RepID=UPI0001E0BC8E|nr:LacI family DNA-binding transcriptional regulator [Ahrensia sp. R2A130]EFL88751.1 HTH-type transcriptional repressor PurR [Ahrensia sp. R2A130]